MPRFGKPVDKRAPGAVLYAGRTADKLSESAKTYRDAFVREYIKDFSGKQALYRIGYTGSQASAITRSCCLLREPYVATLLDETVRTLQHTDVVTRGQVMTHLWDLAKNADTSAARVQATSHIAKMMGMDKVEDSNPAPTGVMMVPLVNPADWSAAAAASQAELKARAATQV